MVARFKGSLTCTCKAGQQALISKHRALVHDRLTQEANARRRDPAAAPLGQGAVAIDALDQGEEPTEILFPDPTG